VYKTITLHLFYGIFIRKYFYVYYAHTLTPDGLADTSDMLHSLIKLIEKERKKPIFYTFMLFVVGNDTTFCYVFYLTNISNMSHDEVYMREVIY
jgi:hypothetical protein